MKTWKCKVCNHVVAQSAMLTAPSPFDPDDQLLACPKCKQCDEGFTELCDEPGCRQEAHCGWPSKEGYRRTCGDHMKGTA